MATSSDEINLSQSLTILEEAQVIQNIDDSPKGLPETKTDNGTFLFLGETGSGKSSLINSLLREEVAIVSDGPMSTRHKPIEEHTGTVGGMNVTLIDTRGLSDVSIAEEEKLILKFKKLTEKNVDIVFICQSLFERDNRGLQYTIQLLADNFGPASNIWGKCVIVLTQANLYKEKYRRKKEDDLSDLMVKAMRSWAEILKTRFKECGVEEKVVNRIPVCVAGTDDCLSLPITNNWIAQLLYVCDGIINESETTVPFKKKGIMYTIESLMSIVDLHVRKLMPKLIN